MKRRNFLGFLGGAAVAGPSMAKGAVSGLTIADLRTPGVGIEWGMGGMPGMSENDDELARLRGALTKMIGKSVAQKRAEKMAVGVSMLDPDLAAMRSMSLDFRMRLQQQRNYERNENQQRHWIEQRIADLLS